MVLAAACRVEVGQKLLKVPLLVRELTLVEPCRREHLLVKGVLTLEHEGRHLFVAECSVDLPPPWVESFDLVLLLLVNEHPVRHTQLKQPRDEVRQSNRVEERVQAQLAIEALIGLHEDFLAVLPVLVPLLAVQAAAAQRCKPR